MPKPQPKTRKEQVIDDIDFLVFVFKQLLIISAWMVSVCWVIVRLFS